MIEKTISVLRLGVLRLLLSEYRLVISSVSKEKLQFPQMPIRNPVKLGTNEFRDRLLMFFFDRSKIVHVNRLSVTMFKIISGFSKTLSASV